MAFDLPVVASRVGAIPQMITGDVGVLFPPGHHNQLFAIIKDLYDNHDIIIEMKQNCREVVKRNFTWTKSAKDHINLFEKIM